MAKLKDVAELAGVSITTVSSILNVAGGSKRFSDACIAKVRQAAEQLGYEVNHHSRSLRTGRSEVIGISLTATRALKGRLGWYRSEMIAGALWACIDHNYELMMISEDDQTVSFERGLRHLQQKKIDALIVASPISPNRIELPDLPTEPIALCRYGYETKYPSFVADVDRGAELMFNHLVELGHRRIAFLCPENMADVPVDMGRFIEVEDWCKANAANIDGFELDFIPTWKWPISHSFMEALNLSCNRGMELMDKGKHTAYLCWNEVIAQGIYQAAEIKGLNIPHDISVACFGDLFARYQHPSLTAVNYREAEMTHKAGEFLITSMLDNADFSTFQNTKTLIEPALMVRESTSAAAQ